MVPDGITIILSLSNMPQAGLETKCDFLVRFLATSLCRFVPGSRLNSEPPPALQVFLVSALLLLAKHVKDQRVRQLALLTFGRVSCMEVFFLDHHRKAQQYSSPQRKVADSGESLVTAK